MLVKGFSTDYRARDLKKSNSKIPSNIMSNYYRVAVSKIGFGEGTTFEFYLKMNKGKYFGMFSSLL